MIENLCIYSHTTRSWLEEEKIDSFEKYLVTICKQIKDINIVVSNDIKIVKGNVIFGNLLIKPNNTLIINDGYRLSNDIKTLYSLGFKIDSPENIVDSLKHKELLYPLLTKYNINVLNWNYSQPFKKLPQLYFSSIGNDRLIQSEKELSYLSGVFVEIPDSYILMTISSYLGKIIFKEGYIDNYFTPDFKRFYKYKYHNDGVSYYKIFKDTELRDKVNEHLNEKETIKLHKRLYKLFNLPRMCVGYMLVKKKVYVLDINDTLFTKHYQYFTSVPYYSVWYKIREMFKGYEQVTNMPKL